MLNYIIGSVFSIHDNYAIIEVNQIGLLVYITKKLKYEITSKNEDNIFLFTRLIITENDFSLYGFYNENERTLFDALTQVQGVGPKLAISILFNYSLEELADIILSQDISSLCKIKGVGKKTANRILLELKDKKELFSNFETKENFVKYKKISDEAVQALMLLGCSKNKASLAVQTALSKLKDDFSIEDLIKESLKYVK